VDAAFRNVGTHAPTLGTYDQEFPTAQPATSAVTLYQGTVNWTLPFAKFTSITAYQINDGRSNTDESEVYDAALGLFGGGADAWQLHVDDHTRKFTQELRLSSQDTGWFQWLVGGFLDHQQTSEIVNLLDASNPGGLFLGLPPFISNLPSTYREFAGYADATVKLTSQFDIGLGIRYSQQHQTYDETVYGLLATGSDAVLHPPLATSNQSVETYLINPRYQITPDTMVYVRVASGFRPGGPNFVLAPGLGNPTFQPDKLWNYELGEKSTLFDKRATLDVDVYDIQWSDIQVTVNNGGVNQLENAGNARVQGVEAAFAYRVLPNFTLTGSAALADAQLSTAAPVLGLGNTHARLPLSPKFNLAVLGAYDFDIANDYSGRFSVSERYQGDRTIGFGTPVSPLYRLGRYNLVDLDLALYAPRNVELDVFAKNIFDVAGEVSAATIADEYNPGAPVPVTLTQPRTVGVGLKVRFN
jgi:outer membrane receptor protein involved in Fe transport